MKRFHRVFLFLLLTLLVLSGCGKGEDTTKQVNDNEISYDYKEYPLERNGIDIHLDSVSVNGKTSQKDCSNCWHYDGEYSPNGGRRDICVSEDVELIDLTKLKSPTLIICGDNDPYLNYDKVTKAKEKLPEESELEMINGGSHAVMLEKPYYHDFQDRLIRFLGE